MRFLIAIIIFGVSLSVAAQDTTPEVSETPLPTATPSELLSPTSTLVPTTSTTEIPPTNTELPSATATAEQPTAETPTLEIPPTNTEFPGETPTVEQSAPETATSDAAGEITETLTATPGEVTATTTETPVGTTLTATPMATVQGRAAYQNRQPDHSGIQITILNGSRILLNTAVTDSAGVYSVAVPTTEFYWLVVDAALHRPFELGVWPGETPPDVVLLGGDLNDDGCVGPSDLALLTAQFELADTTATDITGDGITAEADLAILAGNYDATCETPPATATPTSEPSLTPEMTAEPTLTVEVTADLALTEDAIPTP
jgi:hypothetical protein